MGGWAFEASACRDHGTRSLVGERETRVCRDRLLTAFGERHQWALT
jgi:hypothetical protein